MLLQVLRFNCILYKFIASLSLSHSLLFTNPFIQMMLFFCLAYILLVENEIKGERQQWLVGQLWHRLPRIRTKHMLGICECVSELMDCPLQMHAHCTTLHSNAIKIESAAFFSSVHRFCFIFLFFLKSKQI